MKSDKLIRIAFKSLIACLFLPILFGAFFFSGLFEKILRRGLREKGRDEVIRLISYKGLFGIFDLIGRRRRS